MASIRKKNFFLVSLGLPPNSILCVFAKFKRKEKKRVTTSPAPVASLVEHHPIRVSRIVPLAPLILTLSLLVHVTCERAGSISSHLAIPATLCLSITSKVSFPLLTFFWVFLFSLTRNLGNQPLLPFKKVTCFPDLDQIVTYCTKLSLCCVFVARKRSEIGKGIGDWNLKATTKNVRMYW